MSSGTISDILMLMNKGALSALEVTLFKVKRRCFMNSVLPCCNPCSHPVLQQTMDCCGVQCLLITWLKLYERQLKQFKYLSASSLLHKDLLRVPQGCWKLVNGKRESVGEVVPLLNCIPQCEGNLKNCRDGLTQVNAVISWCGNLKCCQYWV